ncbi:Sec-independent protein translocase TatB [Frondihabitans peucedani]|uniref:Twin-arginine translocase TatA/TatE family subunit n=1 Tax=Frondihabitans peucedani TaxID=598626 RepID=A0ABP8E437_9MICO
MFQNFDKLFVIALIAVLLLGPARLPIYAQKLAQLVKTVRGMADTARDRMRDEMGDEFSDVDWQKLDPRQYDPRRIIRDALLEEPTTAITTPASASAEASAAAAVTAGLPAARQRVAVVPLAAGEAPPYDNEAT